MMLKQAIFYESVQQVSDILSSYLSPTGETIKMKIAGSTVLITGGASGIGLAFAERFLKNGCKVIICGRRKESLETAKHKNPGLITRVCDISDTDARVELVKWVKREYPEMNLLVNNAGVQHRGNLLDPGTDWDYHRQELATNLEAPIHLITLFMEHLSCQSDSGIINVTSGLAFIPLPIAPLYCATKAALHSFTMSLRHQLTPAGITVVEVAPPLVNTDLGGTGLHNEGVSVEVFGDAVFKSLSKGNLEIGYGTSERGLQTSRGEFNGLMKLMGISQP